MSGNDLTSAILFSKRKVAGAKWLNFGTPDLMVRKWSSTCLTILTELVAGTDTRTTTGSE